MAMKNVLTTSVPASPKNLPTINSQRRTGRESTVYKRPLLDFFRDQSDADEDGDHHAEQRDRGQAKIDHHQAFDVDRDLSDQNRRSRHQQGEHDQVVEHAVAHRFAEGVGGNMYDARVHTLTPAFAPTVASAGCSFCTK